MISDFQKDIFLVIGCGKAKIWDKDPHLGPVPSQVAYTGGLFRLCRRYAELYYPDRWLILSAKYGLVLPDEPIEKYDVSFKSANKMVVKVNALVDQCQYYFGEARKVICIAGREYILILESALQRRIPLESPLAHMGLFARMAWLKTQIHHARDKHGNMSNNRAWMKSKGLIGSLEA